MNLTREQITEGNVKLAKLLGWYEGENQGGSWFVNEGFAIYVAYSIVSNHPHRDLPFHRDWNYLMQVIDKIGTLEYHREGDASDYNWKLHYSYGELFQNISSKWLHYRFEENKEVFNLLNDLKSTWCGCVAYVDWYELNKNK